MTPNHQDALDYVDRDDPALRDETEYVPDHDDRPTGRQLSYLKALAERTGQTFAWPRTAAQASREIRRLKQTRPSTRVERHVERHDDRPVTEAIKDAAAVQHHETLGYGSGATWSQRS